MKGLVIQDLEVLNFQGFVGKHKFALKDKMFIVGENGGGKSSILAALDLAFNNRKRSGSLEHCINVNKTVAEVHVSGVYYDEAFEIVRKLSRTGSNVSELRLSGNLLTGKEALDKIGMLFKGLEYSFINEMATDLVNATPMNRFVMLEDVFGSVAEEHIEKAKENRDAVKTDISVYQKQIEMLDGKQYRDVREVIPQVIPIEQYENNKVRVKNIDALLSESTSMHDVLRGYAADIDRLNGDARDVSNKLDAGKSRVLEVEQKYKQDLTALASEYDEELKAYQSEIARYDEEIQQVGKQLSGRVEEGLEQIQKMVEVDLSDYGVSKKEFDACGVVNDSVLGGVDMGLFASKYNECIVDSVSALQDYLKSVQDEYQGRVDALAGGGKDVVTCPNCGSSVSVVEYHQRRLDDYQPVYDKVIEEWKTGVVSEYMAQAQSLGASVSTVCGMGENIADVSTRKAEVENRLQGMPSLASREVVAREKFDLAVEYEKKAVVDLESRLLVINKDIAEKQKLFSNLKNRLDEYDVNALSKEQATLLEQNDRYDSVEKQNMEIQAYNKSIESEKHNDKVVRKDYAKKLDDARQTLSMWSDVYVILREDLPKYAMRKSVEKLGSVINQVIADVYGKYKVKFSVDGKGVELDVVDGEQVLKISQLSGFEKMLVNLSYGVAISLLFGTQVFVADEVDAMATDDNSVEVIRALFRYLVSYNLVVVITHRLDTVREIVGNSDVKIGIVCLRDCQVVDSSTYIGGI